MATINLQTPSEEGEESVIEMTFNLLKSGEKEIKLHNQHKKLVLVVGDTGNGKSKFTTWIAGYDAQLISKETVEDTGEYVIEDIRGKLSSTITSDTVYPTLVVDTETNVPYYDCPGFDDSRSSSNDIATTYFIKKILDFSDSVKIIFIINYPSVRKGVDRLNFMRLLTHAVEFIKSIEKFQNSVALVVTKVDNIYIKGGTVLVADNKVIATIADFLEEVKQELTLKVKNSTSMERRFYEAAIKLISYLLKKDGEQYVNIGIFRRPDQSGSLNDISLLRNGKENIKRIIYKNLKFTDKDDADFGYTISVKSKLIIGRLVEELNNSVWQNVGHIVDEIAEYYRNLFNVIRTTVKSFKNSSDSKPPDQSSAEKLSSYLKQGYRGILDLIKAIDSGTSLNQLTRKLKTIIVDLQITGSQDNLLNIEDKVKYFDFLQVVSEEKLNIRNWKELFKRLENLMSDFWKRLQEDIDDVGPEIQRNMSSCFDWITKDLQWQLDENIKELDIQEVSEQLKNYSDFILCLAERYKNSINIKDHLKSIRATMRCINISVHNDSALTIIKLNKYFKFLKNFSEKDFLLLSDNAKPLENIMKHLDESKTWYNFLLSLYCNFSRCKIQMNKDKYNVANLIDWEKSNSTQGIFITEDTFHHFSQNISRFRFGIFTNVKNITLTKTRLEELNQVLNLTLRQQIEINIEQPSIFLTGDYIRISDIVSHLDSKLESIKFIYIFALRAIFIDADLILPGLNLAIISPNWEIIGKREINVNGEDGKLLSRSKANDGSGAGKNGEDRNGQWGEDATLSNSSDSPTKEQLSPGVTSLRDASEDGRNGDDGDPGLPGKPGGTFFGIGETFFNGEHLTISANGGKGGAGQCGEDGHNGESGQDAKIPNFSDLPTKDALLQGVTRLGGFSCAKIEKDAVYNPFKYIEIYRLLIAWNSCSEIYEIYGNDGKRGGNGGNGGKGGEGGNPGVINLCELKASSGIVKLCERGKTGTDGKGGKKGLGGKRGRTIVAQFLVEQTDILVAIEVQSNIKINIITIIHSNERGDSGSNGIKGLNTRGLKPSELSHIISDPFKIINRYKKYLIKHLDCRFKRSLLLSFLDAINKNEGIKSLYSTVGLIEEFQDIEKERSSLKQSLCIHLYQLMLDRIYGHANRMNSLEGEGEMKALKYLYTVILSRISIVANKTQTDLIMDLGKYLDTIKNDIEALKELQMTDKKLSIIHKYKEDYECDINRRIEEAQNFMAQILPEFHIIEQEIDSNVHSLIEETIKLQQDAERDYLNVKRAELEKSLAQKQIFNCFRLIAGVVNFLATAGKAAGQIIETTTLVLEPLVLNNPETPQILDSNLPSVVQLFINKIDGFTNGSLSFLNQMLRVVSNEIKKYPEFLQDLLPTIERIDEQKNNLSRITEIKTLENDLKSKLKKKEETLKPQKGNKNANDALKVISMLNKIAEFGSLLVSLGKDEKIANSKLEELASAIDRADKMFHSLKLFEENIYNSIAPMMKNMEENIFNAVTNLDSKSRIALDVTKWQVQSSLKNIQFQIQELTQGFKSQHNIVRCFDMLQEAMITIIKIYDDIEYYREQKTLANYIADISSVAVNDINIRDQKLVNALNHLDITLKSNLILKRYKTALDSFNQWVFPFSQSYIDESMLPHHFRFEDNVENLVSVCVSHIEFMKKNVDAYKISIMKIDENIHQEEFSSRNFTTQPFFVWKNENFKYLLSRLLSGEEIILNAEVKKSPLNKDAIKFNLIEFLFNCKNESLQSRLDKILREFCVMATHTGNSYYRYRNKIYLITSDPQTIFYSFDKKANGERVQTNVVYEKIRKGDLMLSPYAIWRLKLDNSSSRSSFDELKAFENEIDLELAGHGSYVRNLIQLDLADEDYRLVKIYEESDRYLD